jgi:small-conductance mechanosensitive channel
MNILPLSAVAFLLLAATCSLQAQPPQGVSPEAEVERASTAPVKLNGTVLLRVRGVGPFSGEQRANAINTRLEAAAGDDSTPPDAVRVKESEIGSTIVAGERALMAVTDLDASHEGIDRKVLAESYRVKITDAIIRFREDRRPQLLFIATLEALGATLALVAVLFLGNRLFKRAYSAVERSFRSKVENERNAPSLKVQVDRLWSPMSTLLRFVRTVALLPIVFLYTGFILGVYPWTRQISRDLLGILLNPVKTLGRATVDALPSLFFLLVFAVIVRFTLKLIMLVFEAIENGAISFAGFDREWSMPTYRIVRILVIAFALVVAYPYVPGSHSDAFKGVSLFLGVVFSLSSSSAIANIIAGYTLTYRRAYRVGDRVRIGDSLGDVEEIRLQATFVRSIKNEMFIIPNSEVLNTSVINYSALAKRRGLILHTTVGIGYETPWRLVESMLLESARRTSRLLREPPPFVLQTSLGDFAVAYEINAYCEEPNAIEAIYSDLHRNILDIFNEQGVQIMTPAYISDPAEPKLVPPDQQFPKLSELSKGS